MGRRVKLSVLGRAVSNAGSQLEGPAGAVPNLGFLARGGGVTAAPGLPRGDAGERFLQLLASAVLEPYGPALRFLLGVFIGDGSQLGSSFCPGLTTGNASLCPFSSLNSSTQRINL